MFWDGEDAIGVRDEKRIIGELGTGSWSHSQEWVGDGREFKGTTGTGWVTHLLVEPKNGLLTSPKLSIMSFTARRTRTRSQGVFTPSRVGRRVPGRHLRPTPLGPWDRVEYRS